MVLAENPLRKADKGMDKEEREELNLRININAMFRRRVVEEDNLISQRLSCMIWTEALLLAAWSATFVKALDTHPKTGLRAAVDWILLGSSGAGIVIAAFGWIGIHAARSEIDKIKLLYQSEFPDVKRDSRIPELTGDSKNHFLGHRFPLVVPVVFLALQVVLIIVWRLLP